MSEAAKTRRADRKAARETKKADIQSGASRKDARDAKHAIKSSDRAQWKADGQSIDQSIKDNPVSDAIADGARDAADEIVKNPEELV